MDPRSERSETLGVYIQDTTQLVGSGALEGNNYGCDDPMALKPGYFDHRTGAWHDRCTGHSTILPAAEASGPFDVWKATCYWKGNRVPRQQPSPETCPVLQSKNDIWVHFVGDSVMRGWFLRGFLRRGMSTGRIFHGDPSKNRPDYAQIPLVMGEEEGSSTDGRPRIWATLVYDEINKSTAKGTMASMFYNKLPWTWGDFLAKRKYREGDTDPNFPPNKVPDVVFYGPGYHASSISSSQFGEVVDNMLNIMEEGYRAVVQSAPSSPLPQIHLVLNMMPATWLFPKKYALDRPYRTMLNEHRKNRAMIAVARAHSRNQGGLVAGVMDAFSIELPFNGKGTDMPTAHGDVVHLGVCPDSAELTFAAVGDRMLEAVCSNTVGAAGPATEDRESSFFRS